MDYHSGVKSNKSNISLHFSQVNSYKEVSLSLEVKSLKMPPETSLLHLFIIKE